MEKRTDGDETPTIQLSQQDKPAVPLPINGLFSELYHCR